MRSLSENAEVMVLCQWGGIFQMAAEGDARNTGCSMIEAGRSPWNGAEPVEG